MIIVHPGCSILQLTTELKYCTEYSRQNNVHVHVHMHVPKPSRKHWNTIIIIILIVYFGVHCLSHATQANLSNQREKPYTASCVKRF